MLARKCRETGVGLTAPYTDSKVRVCQLNRNRRTIMAQDNNVRVKTTQTKFKVFKTGLILVKGIDHNEVKQFLPILQCLHRSTKLFPAEIISISALPLTRCGIPEYNNIYLMGNWQPFKPSAGGWCANGQQPHWSLATAQVQQQLTDNLAVWGMRLKKLTEIEPCSPGVTADCSMRQPEKTLDKRPNSRANIH